MFIVIYNFFHFINKTIRLQIIFVFIRKNRIYISCTYLKVEILSSNCWWKKMKLQRSVIINELCFHSKYVYTVVCFDSSDLIYYLCIISVNKNKIFNNSMSLVFITALQFKKYRSFIFEVPVVMQLFYAFISSPVTNVYASFNVPWLLVSIILHKPFQNLFLPNLKGNLYQTFNLHRLCPLIRLSKKLLFRERGFQLFRNSILLSICIIGFQDYYHIPICALHFYKSIH